MVPGIQRGGVTLPLKPAVPYTVYATAMSDTRLGKTARELLQSLKAATEHARIHTMHE